MNSAELAQTKELAFLMTERFSMNPISAKLLNEAWAKAFPDEVAVAERMMALVEALEKAQQSVELVDLQRDKIKRLESDLWDKEQLRKVHSEKSFELEGKVRELEARNQKDFVWRGKEISRLNDEVDELKERLESRTVTVKLAEDRAAESEISGYDGTEFYRSGWNARGKADRDALAAAGIQVIEGEGQ